MAHVVVIGAGGNIGSHVVAHLGRMTCVSEVTLIDRDRYEPSNLRTQAIDTRDVGRPKASAQAHRLRRINPDLKVTAMNVDVADMPLGRLRSDVVLACLDSRRARLVVNQAAWRLGVPWVNAGVDGGQWLVRVQTFQPTADAACLECAWDQSDYDAVEQTYPCQAGPAAAPTNASSSLGALAAALQAIECEKLLTAEGPTLAGRDIMIDARHHTQWLTSFRRNPDCRMPDHGGWHISPLRASASRLKLRGLVVVGGAEPTDTGDLTFGVAGQRMVLRLICPTCGVARHTFRLERTVRTAPACRHCGSRLRPAGFDLHDAAPLSSAPRTAFDWELERLGVRAGDVITLSTSGVETHYEVGGES